MARSRKNANEEPDSDDDAVELELDFRPNIVVLPREDASNGELREVFSYA